MKYERIEYISGDRFLWVDFVFIESPSSGWMIYIINDIDYKDRLTDGHSTHRNHFRGDTYKSICWNGRLNTIKEAKAVASLWADTTALYIKNNGRFDDIAKRLLKNKGGFFAC